MNASNFNLSQKELLIRIDERQQTLSKDVDAIKHKLISKQEHQNLMTGAVDLEKRIEMLEQWQAKIMGQIAILSVFGGLLSAFIFDLVLKTILQ